MSTQFHSLQEGRSNSVDAFLHTHLPCREERHPLPLSCSCFCGNMESCRLRHDGKPLPVSTVDQRDLPCMQSSACRPCSMPGFFCSRSSDPPWQLHQSPCRRLREAPQLSTSSVASSTLENMDHLHAGELAAQNQQITLNRPPHLQGLQWAASANSHPVGFGSEDGAAQHSSQASADDQGSSVQVSRLDAMSRAHHVIRVRETTTAGHHRTLQARVPVADESCCQAIHGDGELRNYRELDGDDGATASPCRKKRKRARICKNSEEVESQRMTHIAVERNRRRQMNEHLDQLRSLIPAAYTQRGDQASIVGGAINFIKELEHILQALQSKKQHQNYGDDRSLYNHISGLMLKNLIHIQPPLHQTQCSSKFSYVDTPNDTFVHMNYKGGDVDVKLVGSHVLVKILTKKLPQLLLHASLSLESLHLRILHLSITTIEQSVLYAFNLEIQDKSEGLTAKDIAKSIQNIFGIEM